MAEKTISSLPWRVELRIDLRRELPTRQGTNGSIDACKNVVPRQRIVELEALEGFLRACRL